MTETHLTIEQIREFAENGCSSIMCAEEGQALGKQLLATMQREAKLREALGNISRMMRTMDSGINLITLGAAIEIAKKALENTSEYPDNSDQPPARAAREV